MTLNEYQEFAARGIHEATLEREPVVGFALGLAGEAGEVVDDIKKRIFHGREVPVAHTAEELGDVLWYVANIATQYNLSLEDILRANVAKLRKRYPELYNNVDVTFYGGRKVIFKRTGDHIKMCDAISGTYIKFLNKEEKRLYGFDSEARRHDDEERDELPWE